MPRLKNSLKLMSDWIRYWITTHLKFSSERKIYPGFEMHLECITSVLLKP